MILRFTSLFFLLLTTTGLTAQLTVEIDNPDTTNVCLGQTVNLTASSNALTPTFEWSPDGPVVTPLVSRFYTVTVSDGLGNVASDSIFIDVDRLVIPELLPDTTVCEGFPIQIVDDPLADAGDTEYFISPGFLFEDSMDINAFFSLSQDTVLTVVSRALNGACTNVRRVNLEVDPGQVDIAADTIFQCVNEGLDTLVFSAVASPEPDGALTWRPADFVVSDLEGQQIEVFPETSITYFVSATINGCLQEDSVRVQIDSLPTGRDLTLDPEKDIYCQGDTILVKSEQPAFDVGAFPLIEHTWNARGIASPNDLYNAVIQADTSTFLIRETRNGGCRVADSIFIEVAIPPVIEFTPQAPELCPGESVQVETNFVSGSGTVTFMDPMMSLSCTDCPNPVATPPTTTTYEVEVISEDSDCNSPQMYTVAIRDADVVTQLDNAVICSGDVTGLIASAAYPIRITGGGIDTDDARLTVAPEETTVYTVTTFGPCDTVDQEVTVTVLNDVDLTIAGDDMVCPGDETTLTASLNDPSAGENELRWTIGNNEIGRGQSVTFFPTQTINTVTLTYTGPCGTVVEQFTVNQVGDGIAPVVAVSVNGEPQTGDVSVASGNTVTLSVENLPAGGDYSFAWDGNFSPSTSSEPTISVQVPASGGEALAYDVLVTDLMTGCEFPASITLVVEEVRVEIPNIITPNADGRNDGFRVFYNGQISEFSLVILNRWGQKVFTSNDPDEAWDGTVDGKAQNMDTYYYITRFMQSGTEQERDGEFTLVR